jgi:hypothetical protein
MRFGTWNVRRQYREGSLTTAARELDLVGMQEVRWDRRGTVRAGFIFFLWRRKRKASIANRIFCTPQNSVSS